MFQPLLQISLKAFIHREVTRNQGYEFTSTYFAFIDDFTLNVETLRTNYFQKSIVLLSMKSIICFTTLLCEVH